MKIFSQIRQFEAVPGVFPTGQEERSLSLYKEADGLFSLTYDEIVTTESVAHCRSSSALVGHALSAEDVKKLADGLAEALR